MYPRSFHARILSASIAVLGLLATPMARAEKLVHLFILSGQSNMRNLDPNESFTPTVTAALEKDEVIVVKDAEGGQPIYRWYKRWRPPAKMDGPGNRKIGDLYGKLMRKVDQAVEARKPDTITFVWMQGESDAADGYGEVYAKSLDGLIRQLRTDMKRPDINVVIGRISDAGSGSNRAKEWDQVRAAQEKVAEADPQAVWIDTDDLNGQKNGVHYDKPGYLELGKRFAAAALGMLIGTPAAPSEQPTPD